MIIALSDLFIVLQMKRYFVCFFCFVYKLILLAVAFHI